MVTSKSNILRTLSPKKARYPTPGDKSDSEDEGDSQRRSFDTSKAPMERKGSLGGSRKSFRHPLRKAKTFEGDDDAVFQREWGITKQQEEELLESFRKSLLDCGALKPPFGVCPCCHTDLFTLRRFLRARQHDLKRAKDMFVAHIKWRAEFGVDALDGFVFHERDSFIMLYPQGYHMTDKIGRPIYIQHLGAINMKKIHEVTTEERMLKFHVQEYERCARYIFPACSKVHGRHIDSTFAILDVKGVGLKHLTSDVRRMLGAITGIDQNNYPEMLGHTCIINAPSVFKMVWGFVKPYLDVRTQGKVEVCPKDYLPALLKWVDKESLPEYLGGTSKHTLLDDAGPWQEPRLVAEIDADLARIHRKKDIREEPELEANAAQERPKGEAGAPASVCAEGGPLQQPSSLSAPNVEPAAHAARDGPPPVVALGALSACDAAAPSAGPDLDLEDATEDWCDAASTLSRSHSTSSVGEEEPPRSPMLAARLGLGAELRKDAAGPEEFTGMASKAPPILKRVEKLEAAVPGLQERLKVVHEARGLRPASSGVDGKGTLLARVEALEDAYTGLLQAQEAALEQGKDEERSKNKACCACCTVM